MSRMIISDNSLLSLHRTCYLISYDYRDTRGLIGDDFLQDIFE